MASCKYYGQEHHTLGPCPPTHMRSHFCSLCQLRHGIGEVCGPLPLPQVAGPKAPADAPAKVNPKAAQGAKKHCLRLLPLPAEVEVNRALEDGVGKYGAANWRESGVAATVYVDAARRHLAQWFDGGQERAADSNVHNLGHAMACLAILLDAQWNNTLHDDRPAPCRDTDALLLRS